MINAAGPLPRIQGKCSPPHLLTFSPAHFLTRTGFTLLEILAVVTIIGLSVTLMASVFAGNADQVCMERTLESMKEIKKAILGSHSQRIRGNIRFAGYVPNMGALPELVDENGDEVTEGGQPKGLWTSDINNDQINELPLYKSYKWGGEYGSTLSSPEHHIFVGWRGPYLRPPAGGVLKDAWTNPFIFEKDGKNFVIKSLGADGSKGGTGYDRDIVIIIKDKDYLARVAGYIRPFARLYSNDSATVSIRYQPPEHGCPSGKMLDCILGQVMSVQVVQDGQDDGYFHFDDIPVGAERMLTVSHSQFDIYKIDIEPGINWLGNMGNIP